jgi:hypothetical protein
LELTDVWNHELGGLHHDYRWQSRDRPSYRRVA